MSSLKEIKNRITSVTSTKKITSAMKMVSSAKLHHAEGMIRKALPYDQRLSDLLRHLLAAIDEASSPYTQVRPRKQVALVAFSSDTGLCGTFNANLIKATENKIRELQHAGIGVQVYPVGKKVAESLRKSGYDIRQDFLPLAGSPDYAGASTMASALADPFVSGEIDGVELLYHHFKNTAAQELICRTWLPFPLSETSEQAASGYAGNYILEPSADRLLEALMPRVLRQQLYSVCLDTWAAEQAARVQAMQTASDNANDLLQELTLQYNKSRQQAITNELLDIMGGR